MSKRPYPYDDASEAECLEKRDRLVEKLAAVNTRLRIIAPPAPEVTGPPCKTCSTPSVSRVSKSVKNYDRKFWSCPSRCQSWIGWADDTLVVGTCTVCKTLYKFGFNGAHVADELKDRIAKDVFMCEKCTADVNF